MLPDEAKTRLTRRWLRKARGDLNKAGLLTASSSTTPDVLDGAVFFCQQAAEKALKGFLTWHDQPLRKTHELRALVQACEAVDPGFRALRPASEVLTPYLSEFRYPDGDDEPTPDAVDDALRLARQVLDFVLARVPPTVRP